MAYKLSILIPHKENDPLRNVMLQSLKMELERQAREGNYSIQILVNDRPGEIGDKCNDLMDQATGEYICRFDDDDRPGQNYLKCIFEGIDKGVDVCSLRGIITWDGENPEVYEHSLKFNAYKTNEGVLYPGLKYERFPNHLNAMKAPIAKQFRYPSISHGEDTDWATQVHNSGLLKTEHYIDEVIYHYRFKPNK